jgi:hypothetical protein
MLTQSFSQWLTFAAFKMNRDYISKNLCENRSRPVLQCRGNCVLMKKMKQEQQDEKNSSNSQKAEFSSLVLSSKSFYPTSNETPLSGTHTARLRPGNTGKPVHRSQSIFRPPLRGADFSS